MREFAVQKNSQYHACSLLRNLPAGMFGKLSHVLCAFSMSGLTVNTFCVLELNGCYANEESAPLINSFEF